MMRSDDEIWHDVREELDWDPQIGARGIAISVRGRVATLAGFVRTFGERVQAEAGAKRVAGVLGIVNDIEVRLSLLRRRSDRQIAREVLAGIEDELPPVCERIRVRVVDGRVTLEGYVERHHQRACAQDIAQGARGLRGISNYLIVKPRAMSREVKCIEPALWPQATRLTEVKAAPRVGVKNAFFGHCSNSAASLKESDR